MSISKLYSILVDIEVEKRNKTGSHKGKIFDYLLKMWLLIVHCLLFASIHPFLHSFPVVVEKRQCVLKNALEEVHVAGAIRSQEGPE